MRTQSGVFGSGVSCFPRPAQGLVALARLGCAAWWGTLLLMGAGACGQQDGASGQDAACGCDAAPVEDAAPDAVLPQDAAPDATAHADANADAAAPPVLHATSPEELHAALQNKDFLLINVHIPDQGEIPGTDTHIPYTDVDAISAYIGPDLTTKAVVYCMTNHMALIAAPALVQRGYSNIYYLDGGMTAWQEAGYPLDPYP